MVLYDMAINIRSLVGNIDDESVLFIPNLI